MANKRLSYYTYAILKHTKHLASDGQRVPLQPSTFTPNRALTHLEMDYNLAYIEETKNGYKIFGSGVDGTLTVADEGLTLIFHKVLVTDTNIITAGYPIDTYVWVPRLNDTTIIPPVQGYIGLLSAFYFDGLATSSEIIINQVDVWQDVIMTIHPSGINDERPVSMKLAQPTGYEGTGAVNDPIIFLLEGLVESSFATLRTSFGFTPDEDGGRLDARIFLNRHNGAGADFFIDGQSLTMESGADEEYAHLVSVEFFVGDTMDTNATGDAGKVRFQIKSDVTGTVSMREMALFIQI